MSTILPRSLSFRCFACGFLPAPYHQTVPKTQAPRPIRLRYYISSSPFELSLLEFAGLEDGSLAGHTPPSHDMSVPSLVYVRAPFLKFTYIWSIRRWLQVRDHLKLLCNFNTLGAFVHPRCWRLDRALHNGVDDTQKLK